MSTTDLQSVAEYLDEYLDVQQALLDVMTEKLDVLSKRSLEEAQALESREAALVERLRHCVERRQELLQDPAVNSDRRPTLRAVVANANDSDAGAANLNRFERNADVSDLSRRFDEAESKAHDLRMKSVTAWVLAQRSVVHWSQMLEIVAAQGRSAPTYKRDRKLRSRGALIDQAG